MADVNLRWDANPVDEEILEYNVYRNGTLIGATPTPAFTVPGVEPGLNTFQVSAVNAWGESDKSAPATTPPAPTVPGGINIQIIVNVSA